MGAKTTARILSFGNFEKVFVFLRVNSQRTDAYASTRRSLTRALRARRGRKKQRAIFMVHVHFCGESIIDSPRFCSSSVETYGRKEIYHWCGVVYSAHPSLSKKRIPFLLVSCGARDAGNHFLFGGAFFIILFFGFLSVLSIRRS